jgi:hypothetical protein
MPPATRRSRSKLPLAHSLPLADSATRMRTRPRTSTAELEAHQRPIRATSCDFTKACSAEHRREPVIKRDGRTVGAGVDRASIEQPRAVLGDPIEGACEYSAGPR